MTTFRRERLKRVAGLAALLVGLGRGGSTWGASATELVYERTLMGTAGSRCHLFSPDIAKALAAATVQAHGAAIRAGTGLDSLRATEERARDRANSLACDSAELRLAAERLRSAFATYLQITGMSFPGTFADWRAERARNPPPKGAPRLRWMLVQYAPQGPRPTLFGLSAGWAEDPGRAVLTLVCARPQALSAMTARLLMRDPARLAAPYLDPRRHDIAGHAPPRGLERVFLASAKAPAPASLSPRQSQLGAAFLFPPQATLALAQLDPREGAALELVYAGVGGERVETAWIEVGDFAAAQAFLATPQPARPAGR